MENHEYFSKDFYKKCIKVEVYRNKKLNLFWKIWLRFFNLETNSVYLIRKYLYKSHSSPNSISSRFLHIKLMKKYGTHVSLSTRIGLGLAIKHPSTIMITNAKIGTNCILFHNVTIGAKYEEADIDNSPVIENDVTFFLIQPVMKSIYSRWCQNR